MIGGLANFYFLKKGRDVSDLEMDTASDETQDRDDDIRPTREGLPPGYRMRADRHYVDELTSENLRRQPPAVAPPPPVVPERPAVAARSADLFKSLSEEFTAVESARRLLVDDGGAVARRAALDLIEVHTARAAWLVKASHFIETEAPQPDRRRPLGTLIDELVERFAPEGRLRGVALRARVDDRAYTARFDAQTLSVGLTGALVALLPFVNVDDEPALNVSASRSATSLTVDIVHRSTRLDATSGERFFDGAWTMRPGGWPAALGVRALRRAVEHHGGTVVCEVGPGEARLRLTFPQKAA